MKSKQIASLTAPSPGTKKYSGERTHGPAGERRIERRWGAVWIEADEENSGGEGNSGRVRAWSWMDLWVGELAGNPTQFFLGLDGLCLDYWAATRGSCGLSSPCTDVRMGIVLDLNLQFVWCGKLASTEKFFILSQKKVFYSIMSLIPSKKKIMSLICLKRKIIS